MFLPGHALTHFPHPEQLSSSIFGMKEVVWTGWSIPNFFAANRNSQQQLQQLHIKLTLFFTFSPHLGCLANYNLMDSHLLRGNERETGIGCYIVIVLTCC